MNKHKLRFAIIGLDHWYSAVELAQTLMSHPNTELIGIADNNEDHAREVAEQIGLDEYTTDLQKYIHDDRIDVVASFVTVDQNPAIVIAAAEAGKDIISVKPFANTLEEGSRIVEAVRKAGITFVPAETRLRQSELNRYTKNLIDNRTLGEVVSGNFNVISSLPQNWPDAPFDGGWWVDPSKVPGGGWIDHAIYQVDRLRWFLGEEPVRISGRIANLVHPELQVEDYGHAIVEFASGATFTIEDTWSGPFASWRVSSTIIGTEGAVSQDTTSPDLTVFGMGGSGWTTQPAPDDDSSPLEPLIAHFTGADTALFGGVEDAWANLAVCLAFYEAAKSGTAVAIPHLAAHQS